MVNRKRSNTGSPWESNNICNPETDDVQPLRVSLVPCMGLCGLSRLLPKPELEAQTLQPPRFLLQWGGEGVVPGKFTRPMGIAVDHENFVYVSDTENQRIQKFTSAGEFVLTWGRRGKQAGELDRPMHLSIAPDGRVYVTEYANDRIQVFDREGNSLAL